MRTALGGVRFLPGISGSHQLNQVSVRPAYSPGWIASRLETGYAVSGKISGGRCEARVHLPRPAVFDEPHARAALEPALLLALVLQRDHRDPAAVAVGREVDLAVHGEVGGPARRGGGVRGRRAPAAAPTSRARPGRRTRAPSSTLRNRPAGRAKPRARSQASCASAGIMTASPRRATRLSAGGDDAVFASRLSREMHQEEGFHGADGGPARGDRRSAWPRARPAARRRRCAAGARTIAHAPSVKFNMPVRGRIYDGAFFSGYSVAYWTAPFVKGDRVTIATTPPGRRHAALPAALHAGDRRRQRRRPDADPRPGVADAARPARLPALRAGDRRPAPMSWR